MKFRLINKLWAKAFGLFWTPCPLCGQYFGGHEWKSASTPDGQKEWNKDNNVFTQMGSAICPDCEDAPENAELDMMKPGVFRADVVTDYLDRHRDAKS